MFKLTDKYNQICLCQKDYKSEEEFWETIKNLIKILIRAHCEIECYQKCAGTYIFNFNPNHRYYDSGIPHIEWIDPSIEDIISTKEEDIV